MLSKKEVQVWVVKETLCTKTSHIQFLTTIIDYLSLDFYYFSIYFISKANALRRAKKYANNHLTYGK